MEHDTPETQARALAALSPAEAAPLIACMIAAEWQTQQNIIGLGDHDIPDFATVHEHVDGNMLGYELVEHLLGPNAPTERVIEYVSAAQAIVDEYLRLRHAANV